jgi:hypothetical protein
MLWPVRPAAEESVNVNLRYLCLVYEDEEKIDALPEPESASIADQYCDHLGELQQSGHFIASARLQPAESATTVRVRDGSMFISGDPDAGTKKRLGAFYLIEARDLNDAIRIVGKMPGVRQGWIELRPLAECDPG